MRYTLSGSRRGSRSSAGRASRPVFALVPCLLICIKSNLGRRGRGKSKAIQYLKTYWEEEKAGKVRGIFPQQPYVLRIWVASSRQAGENNG